VKKNKIYFVVIIFISLLSLNFTGEKKVKVKEFRKFKFSYIVKIPTIPIKAKSLDLFVPLPKSNSVQKITGLEINTNVKYLLEEDSEYHNEIFHIKLIKNFPREINVRIDFNVNRKLSSVKRYSKDTKLINRFLMSDSLVPITGIVAKEAKKIVSKENISTFKKAEIIFNHVVDTMVYDKKSTTGWGRGDIIYACNARSGNCTDFHSLFIGLNRAEKIPSRFIIGFPIPQNKSKGEISGYHCWAEFYLHNKGWVPVDASEAFKNPERKNFYFGSLDPDRVAFTVGRDVPLKIGNGKIKKVNYLIYPYLFINGKQYGNVETKFFFKDVN